MSNNTSKSNPGHKGQPRMWAIFYEVNGKVHPCITHLGCVQLHDAAVNLYRDEAKLKEIFEQTIAYIHRTERAPEGSGHARWEGWLKTEWQGGRVFISRVGSKDFPATLTAEPKWQTDDAQKWNDETSPKVWAIRVPCKMKG